MAKRELPWDEQTDQFVNEIDNVISKKYNISFRDLLLNPNKYSNKKGFGETFQNIRKDVNSYFEDLLSNFQDEAKKLENELESLTAQYTQINSLIANKSTLLKVPFIKPQDVERHASEEIITIAQYDSSLETLIGKLVSISDYVADVSLAYDKYVFGSWLFSGHKNYVVSLLVPTSDVLTIRMSRDTLNFMLDSIAPAFQ